MNNTLLLLDKRLYIALSYCWVSVCELHSHIACCVVVTMEVEVTSLQGMMGILRNSCIRKKDGGEVSYSGCDAKNRNDSY